jgi:hypothetical protein
VLFFLRGRRGTRTPKHFVNLTGESKTFKMLEFPRNQLQTYYGYLCDLFPLTAFIFSDLNYTVVISLSQTESNTKHFLRKKALYIYDINTLRVKLQMSVNHLAESIQHSEDGGSLKSRISTCCVCTNQFSPVQAPSQKPGTVPNTCFSAVFGCRFYRF